MSAREFGELLLSKNSHISLGLLLVIMGGVWWFSQSFYGILETQRTMQRDISVIRQEIQDGNWWTRESMSGWVREATWRNPEVKWPDPKDFIEKD